MSKVIVTDHAVERFRDRVSSRDSHKPAEFKERVEDWCGKALKHSKQVGLAPDGRRLFRYTDYILVMDATRNIVVTIKPRNYAAGLAKDAEDSIKAAVKRQVMKLVRPYLTRQHELIISIHDNELKRLRVHNPNTKQSIGERIDELNSQLDGVRTEINRFSALAYQYGINVEEEI